jgi:hypothetical protein
MDITPNIIKLQVTFKKASQDYTKPKGYIYTASVACRALQARVPTSLKLKPTACTVGAACPHQETTLKWYLGLLYTRSQGQKISGPTLSILGLQIGPHLLINARTLTSGY